MDYEVFIWDEILVRNFLDLCWSGFKEKNDLTPKTEQNIWKTVLVFERNTYFLKHLVMTCLLLVKKKLYKHSSPIKCYVQTIKEI